MEFKILNRLTTLVAVIVVAAALLLAHLRTGV